MIEELDRNDRGRRRRRRVKGGYHRSEAEGHERNAHKAAQTNLEI